MKAAVIQTRTPATSRNGLRHVAPLIRDAAAKGATLILTPEGTNFLQKDRTLLGAELHSSKDDVCVQGLIALAAELKVWIVIGSALVRGGDVGANCTRKNVPAVPAPALACPVMVANISGMASRRLKRRVGQGCRMSARLIRRASS